MGMCNCRKRCACACSMEGGTREKRVFLGYFQAVGADIRLEKYFTVVLRLHSAQKATGNKAYS